MKILLTIISISISLFCSAQNYTVNGRVVDKSTGQSLNSAYVNVFQDGKKIIAQKVQENGFYTINLSKGNYIFNFINEHYGELNDTLKLNDNIKYDVALYPFVMYSSGKIYVVISVLIVILSALFIYLLNLDRKISRLEKE